MKKHIILLFLISLLAVEQNQAQQMGFGAKGGLLVGTQKSKRALISYQGDLFFETMGKWQGDNILQRFGMVLHLGYHRRGASYNAGVWGASNTFVANDLFHNISLAILLKGSFQTGAFLPYYAVGARLEVTTASSVINQIDAQGVTPVNFGFWLGGGIEWEIPKLPFGLFLELNVSPDLTPQIFFRKGTQIQYTPYGSQTTSTRGFAEDYKIVNISIELSFGVKFIARKSAELPLESD
jgi:hypothetical protein